MSMASKFIMVVGVDLVPVQGGWLPCLTMNALNHQQSRRLRIFVRACKPVSLPTVRLPAEKPLLARPSRTQMYVHMQSRLGRASSPANTMFQGEEPEALTRFRS